MQITLMHPSRGRPDQALHALRMWCERAALPLRIKHILSIDSSDEQAFAYERLFADRQSVIVKQDNKTMVDALNACLPHLPESGPVVTLFDDMLPDHHWDVEIAHKWQPGKLLKVDCETQLQTICAGCSSVFKRWGYIYYPGYISMYADNDYQEHAELEKLFAICDLRISHNHPAHGTAETDATYERQNHMASYKLGERILTRRRACGFAY
jgi:hypothetical protein